jgi:homoserine dehydrogenase
VNADILALRIGLLGLGTVGSGVAEFIQLRSSRLTHLFGCQLQLARVLVREPQKQRSIDLPPGLLTTDPGAVLDDPSIAIIVEAMGGEQPALDYMRRALRNGKHLVTANKEVLAKHGPELLALAAQHNVDVYYEASVGGGLPLIGPFKRDLLANQISSVRAIINGTTNYILTRMAEAQVDFAAALREAQALGYAEPDPHKDVSGLDAVYKLAILATLAFHSEVRPDQIYCEGITKLSARDFRFAAEMGYQIKLLAIGHERAEGIEARVHPSLVPKAQLLAGVNGVYNAVELDGDLVGRVLLYGRGAGSLPTASAIAGDVIDLARNIRKGISNRTEVTLGPTRRVLPMEDVSTRYYLRLHVADRPGVLADIAAVLGRLQISIAAFIQQEVDAARRSAEIVIVTHRAHEAAIRSALDEFAGLTSVLEVAALLRIEDGS